MKSLIYTSFTILLALLAAFVNAQSLSYSRLTNGLGDPYFEGGHTDFSIDDINMDGHVDILTIGDHGSPFIGTNQHGICIWFGDGQGNFENFQFGDFGYGGIVVGDVNGDGLKDVGYGMHHDYSSTDLGDQILEVALGDGTGTSWTAWDDGLATNGETWGMFGTDFADVDNDGDLDLVSISFGSGAGLHVYLNQGDGSWEQSFGFLNGNSNLIVEFGDFNRDGNPDFIATHEFGTIYFGDGTGDFSNNDDGLPALGAYEARRGVSVGDVNQDGAMDIAFVNSNGGVEMYYWDEAFTGSWISISGDLPASGSFDYTDIADMDGDGNNDLVAMANEIITIWLGDGTGNWTQETQFSLGEDADPEAFRVGGDLDQNGLPDMVLLAETGSWPSYQNVLYCYREDSPADDLNIRLLYPKGGESYHPGSVQFITWASEVPEGDSSSVTIEISAFGPEGPWWLLAEDIPNNGRHQWTVPDFGSEEVYLKFTVTYDTETATATTPTAFTIIGTPTGTGIETTPETISLFPNPGGDFVYLRNPQFISYVRFTDVSGRICFETEQPGDRVDLKNLPEGLYFYEIITNNGMRKNGKWVKN